MSSLLYIIADSGMAF